MLRLFRAAILVPSLVLVIQVIAADNVLNPDRPSENPKVRASLLQADYLKGKLISVEGDNEVKSYILEVTHKAKGINKQMEQKYNDLYKQYLDAASKKDNATIQKLAPEINDVKGKLYEMQEVPYE